MSDDFKEDPLPFSDEQLYELFQQLNPDKNVKYENRGFKRHNIFGLTMIGDIPFKIQDLVNTIIFGAIQRNRPAPDAGQLNASEKLAQVDENYQQFVALLNFLNRRVQFYRQHVTEYLVINTALGKDTWTEYTKKSGGKDLKRPPYLNGIPRDILINLLERQFLAIYIITGQNGDVIPYVDINMGDVTTELYPEALLNAFDAINKILTAMGFRTPNHAGVAMGSGNAFRMVYKGGDKAPGQAMIARLRAPTKSANSLPEIQQEIKKAEQIVKKVPAIELDEEGEIKPEENKPDVEPERKLEEPEGELPEQQENKWIFEPLEKLNDIARVPGNIEAELSLDELNEISEDAMGREFREEDYADPMLNAANNFVFNEEFMPVQNRVLNAAGVLAGPSGDNPFGIPFDDPGLVNPFADNDYFKEPPKLSKREIIRNVGQDFKDKLKDIIADGLDFGRGMFNVRTGVNILISGSIAGASAILNYKYHLNERVIEYITGKSYQVALAFVSSYNWAMDIIGLGLKSVSYTATSILATIRNTPDNLGNMIGEVIDYRILGKKTFMSKAIIIQEEIPTFPEDTRFSASYTRILWRSTATFVADNITSEEIDSSKFKYPDFTRNCWYDINADFANVFKALLNDEDPQEHIKNIQAYFRDHPDVVNDLRNQILVREGFSKEHFYNFVGGMQGLLYETWNELTYEQQRLFALFIILFAACLVASVSNKVGLVNGENGIFSVPVAICNSLFMFAQQIGKFAANTIELLSKSLEFLNKFGAMGPILLLAGVGLGLYLFNKYSPV